MLAALALGMAIAAPARAATVKVEVFNDCEGDVACSKYAGGWPHSSLSFKAAAGERNDVTVTPAGDTIDVRDDGAALTAGSGCTARDEHSAVCDLGGRPRAAFGIDLGDLGDRLRIVGDVGSGRIDGGPGDDDLGGGDEADAIDGGTGADTVAAGAGNDTLDAEDTAGPDSFDGGSGRDVIDYAGRRRGVLVDLSKPGPGAGEPGEGDLVTAVEDVAGGGGPDVLRGDAGANGIYGGSGRDAVFGLGGADSLDGGEGADRVSGGAGDDAIDPSDSAADVLRCGTGRDVVFGVDFDGEYFDEEVVTGPDAGDLLDATCERVAVGDLGEGVPQLADVRLRLVKRSLLLRNPCGASGCRGRLTVGVGRRHARHVRFGSRGRRVRITLDAAAARALRHGAVARVALSFGDFGATFRFRP